jgi:hypothetical protein
MRRFVPAVAGLLAVASVATAADPGGGGGAGGGDVIPPPRIVGRTTGDAVRGQQLPGLDFEGTVVNGEGVPIGSVRVKMFSNGRVVAHTTTDADGTFLLQGNPMRDENHTTDLWFESPNPKRYIDVNVLVSAAKGAVEKGLFPPCTPRVTLHNNTAVIEVTMMSAEERQNDLVTSQCLEGGVVQGPAGP